MLFPKYDIEFFTGKIIDLGKKAPGRVIIYFKLGIYVKTKKNLQGRRKLGCNVQ